MRDPQKLVFQEKIIPPSIKTWRALVIALIGLFGAYLIADFLYLIIGKQPQADDRFLIISIFIGIAILFFLRGSEDSIQVTNQMLVIVNKGIGGGIGGETWNFLISDIKKCQPVTYIVTRVNLSEFSIKVLDENKSDLHVDWDSTWLPFSYKRTSYVTRTTVAKRKGVFMEITGVDKKVILQSSKPKELCDAITLKRG